MKIIKLPVMLTLAGLFLAGCASSALTSVWSDKTYTQKPIQSIMVLGVMDNVRDRNIFESEMKAALEKTGAHAVASSSILGKQKITKENVLRAATKNNIQAVLVTRLVGTKKEEVYHPPISNGVPVPYYRTWDGFYSHMHSFSYRPGYTATYTSVVLETSIYAINNHDLIWSAASETFEPEDVNKEIKQLSRILVNKMKESDLVK